MVAAPENFVLLYRISGVFSFYFLVAFENLTRKIIDCGKAKLASHESPGVNMSPACVIAGPRFVALFYAEAAQKCYFVRAECIEHLV